MSQSTNILQCGAQGRGETRNRIQLKKKEKQYRRKNVSEYFCLAKYIERDSSTALSEINLFYQARTVKSLL